MTDLEPIQREAATQAVRRTHRLYTLDPEDRYQDAAEAVLRATPRLDRSQPEGSQIGYLAKRATGAILDTVRARKHSRDAMWSAVMDDDGEAIYNAPDPNASPEHDCWVRERLRALESMRDPLRLVAVRIVEGYTLTHIAAEFSVTPSRISQHLREIVRRLDMAEAPGDAVEDAVEIADPLLAAPEIEPLQIVDASLEQLRQRVRIELDEAAAMMAIFGLTQEH